MGGKSRNIILLILVCAMIIKISLFLAGKPWNEDVLKSRVFYIDSDATRYQKLALLIIQDRSFERFGTFITPGYPVFLAAIYTVCGKRPWVVFLIQVFLSLATLWIIFLLGELVFDEKTGVVASILYAVDPYVLFYPTTLTAETVFLLLFTSSIFLLYKGLSNETRERHILVSAILLGTATLVKPVTLFFPVAALIIINMFPCIKGMMRLKISIIYMIIFCTVIFPWSLRNHSRFGYWNPVSIQGYNLLFYNAALTEAYRTGKSIGSVRAGFREKALQHNAVISSDEMENASFNYRIYQKIAIDYIKENPWSFVIAQAKGVAKIFLHTKSEDVDVPLGRVLKDTFSIPRTADNFLRYPGIYSVIVILIYLFFLLIYSLALTGAFSGLYRKETSFLTLSFIIMITYFAIVTGHVGYGRYKLPMIPFYSIMAARGLLLIHSYWSIRIGYRKPDLQKTIDKKDVISE